jgi:hypothetical protein
MFNGSDAQKGGKVLLNSQLDLSLHHSETIDGLGVAQKVKIDYHEDYVAWRNKVPLHPIC